MAQPEPRPLGPSPALTSALDNPIVQAPMSGGPSTPRLAAAVNAAGGFGFLAAGYRTATDVAGEIAQLRTLTDRPFGVNVFVPASAPGDAAAIAAYATRLAPDAQRLNAATGEPRFDDDDWAAKLDVLVSERPAVASFTFGCPTAAEIARVRTAGIEVWVTITGAAAARAAVAAGAEVLVAQGLEAGGHRATFDARDDDPGPPLLELLRATRAAVDVPVVAAGGIVDRTGVGAVLDAGAVAAALGTAFMRAPEAGTSDVLRAALARPGHETALTRAFTGRLARGIVNRFMLDHPDAPPAYPEIHHLTTPLRAASRARGEGDAVNLWAGAAYARAQERPAGEIVRDLLA